MIRIKHKLLTLLMLAGLIAPVFLPIKAHAILNDSTTGAGSATTSTTASTGTAKSSTCAPNDPTCASTSGDCKGDGTIESVNEKNCGIISYIVIITNVLSALVGVIIVTMIIWGGIQYSTAGADASKVQAAKQKIINALVALVLFVFGFAIVQWLIPGGLF